MRNLLHFGAGAVVLLVMMFAGSLLLWVGIPLGWLWLGSQIQGATDSLGAAIGAMIFGVVASIALAMPALVWLSNRYRAIRMARGHADVGHLMLEAVVVTSAAIALVAFVVWFFGFSGGEPLPVKLGG